MGAVLFAYGLLIAVTASIVGAARRDPRYLYVAALIVTVFLSGITGLKFIVVWDDQLPFLARVRPWGVLSAGLLVGLSIFATARTGRLRWSASIVMALAVAWIAHLVVVALSILEGATAP